MVLRRFRVLSSTFVTGSGGRKAMSKEDTTDTRGKLASSDSESSRLNVEGRLVASLDDLPLWVVSKIADGSELRSATNNRR